MLTLFSFWIGLAIGCFIGWMIPQPQWLQNKINEAKAKLQK